MRKPAKGKKAKKVLTFKELLQAYKEAVIKWAVPDSIIGSSGSHKKKFAGLKKTIRHLEKELTARSIPDPKVVKAQMTLPFKKKPTRGNGLVTRGLRGLSAEAISGW